MGIDWVAMAVLGAAYLFSLVKQVPLRVRLWVFALACFGVAGWKLSSGAQGNNMLFVLLSAVFGVTYVVRALKTPR